MKRFITICLSLLLLITISACGNQHSTEPAVPTSDIVVLYTNDVHCSFDDALGYKSVAVSKNTLTAAGKTVILADVGDHMQGNISCTLSKGASIIEIMNKLGYDVAIPGNHEFDYGMETFFKNMELAEFPYISCNISNEDGDLLLDGYLIKEVNGIKLAFVGITTPNTLSSSDPVVFLNEDGKRIYSFAEDENGEALYNRVQSAVNSARKDGADYVIALAHLGSIDGLSPWSSYDVIAHTTGINVMLDGHSHTVMSCERVINAEGKEVLLSSTGTGLTNIGCLVIDTGGNISVSLINDNGTNELINNKQTELEDITEQVVGHSDYDLVINDPASGKRLIRSFETNLGDLVADAYRDITGADIALANGGSIRWDITAGDINFGQIVSCQPYENGICVCEATGQEILDALEFSVSALPGEFGGFLQVSGISYTVDMSVMTSVETNSAGEFVSVNGDRRIKDVYVGDALLIPDKVYTIVSTDYILKNGGDGYTMFRDNNITTDYIKKDYELVIDYICDNMNGNVDEKYANVYGMGRINIINNEDK